jgi:Protein of unknown function (DUF4239)
MLWFLVACGSVPVASGAAAMIQRWFPHSLRKNYNEANGYFFAAVGVLYTVLLAFVVIAVWEDTRTTQQNIDDEANALPGLYFSSTVFPPGIQKTFQHYTVAYAKDVIDHEWPALANGRSSPIADADANALRRAILQVQPKTMQQEELYRSMIDRINTINSNRRQRITEAEPSIPKIFWCCLLGGAVLLLLFALFFGVPRLVPHLLMVTRLTVIVAGTLYLAYLMEQPFRGPMRLEPGAFEVALVEMNQ